jgi:hypothetical protein
MPCSSCTLHETKFSESSNGKDYVWLCCYCKSSLNSGRFDSSCTNCGHEGPTYGALTCPGSDLMAISVHQVETQQPEPLFPTATSKLSFLPYDPKSRPPYDTKDKFLDPKISPTRDTALSPSPHENPPKPLHVDDTISATPTEASSVTSTVSKLETDEEIEYNSSTDYSDTESAHDCMLERYVQDGAQSLVERLTKNLRFEFDPESAIIRCTAGQKNGSSSSSSHPPSSHADLTIKQSPDRRARIRKRENEEDDSEGENEKIPSKRRKGKSKVESLPLACPFFKRNPRLCTRYRSCSEKGWTQFYRLK